MRPGLAAYQAFSATGDVEKFFRRKAVKPGTPKRDWKPGKGSKPGSKVVDGDGDGLVYDNTTRERPATAGEMAAGRRLRRRRGGAMRTGDAFDSSPQRWVLRGRDKNGKLVIREVNSREEAIKIGRQMQGKKLRNVRAIRLGQPGEVAPEPKPAKIKRPKDRVHGESPDANLPDRETSPPTTRPDVSPDKPDAKPDENTVDPEFLEAAKQTAAYKHFEGGGSVADAPHEGLIESMVAMPDRFTIRDNGSASSRKNAWVVDKNGSGKKTTIAGPDGPEEVEGDVWMLKGGIGEGVELDEIGDDQFNELIATELFRGTGIQMVDTKITEDAEGERWVMQRHVSQQFGGEGETLGGSDQLWRHDEMQGDWLNEDGEIDDDKIDALTEESIMKYVDQEALAKLEDRGSILDMILADFMMGGYDRHGDNWGVHVNENGGYRVQMWDNGGTFTTTSQKPAVEFMDYFAYNSEALAQNFANMILARAALGSTKAEQRKEIRKRLKAFVANMKKIEMEKVKARISEGAVDTKQRRLINKQLKLVSQRLTHLEENIDAITKEIMAL